MNRIIILLSISVSLLFSCEENSLSDDVTIDEFSIEEESAIDANYEDVDVLTSSAVEFSLTTNGRVERDQLLSGAEISHDTTNQIITIDFGEGVEGPQGRIRKGIIIIKYDARRAVAGAFREISFDGFSIDDVSIEGVRTLENTTASTSEGIEFTVTLEGGKMTFPDESFSTRESNKVRNRIFGDIRLEDRALVTGGASGTRRNGVSYSVEILSPITYQRSCRTARVFIPVSGVKQVTRGEDVVVVDFGDGVCDNEVTITVNGGEPVERSLNPRRRNFN